MEIMNIDVVIMVVGILAISEVKRRHPSIFFLSEGVQIWLPPEDDEQQVQGKKRKQKSQQKTFIERWAPAKLQELKQLPLYEQYEKVFMMTSLLVFHTIVSLVLEQLTFLPAYFHKRSSLPFMVTFLLQVYTLYYAWKVSAYNGVRSYEFKASVVIALALTATLALGRGLLSSLLDSGLLHAVNAQSRHFDIILAGTLEQSSGLTTFRTVTTVLVLNFILVLVTIPSIMRFGNGYTDMLQAAYAEDDDQQQGMTEGKKLARQKLKLSYQKELKIYNIELMAWTALLLLWGVPPLRQQLPNYVITWMRIIVIILATVIGLRGFSQQMELHLYKARKHLKSLQQGEEQLKDVRIRVSSYIRYFWFTSYQVLLRIILPALFLLVLLQKGHLGTTPVGYEVSKHHYQISPAHQPPVRVNIESSCGLIKDPVLTLRQLYRCPANPALQFEKAGLNGWELASVDSSVLGIAARVSAYGLFNSRFEAALAEELLWYYLLSRFILTIVYILFLRKTVLDL